MTPTPEELERFAEAANDLARLFGLVGVDVEPKQTLHVAFHKQGKPEKARVAQIASAVISNFIMKYPDHFSCASSITKEPNQRTDNG